MHVTRDMIHPELRTMARFVRIIMPSFTLRSMRRSNKMIKIFLKGKCWNRRIKYEQHYISRTDGSKLRLCVYSPRKPQKNVPGLLWIHGGGYAEGVPEQDMGFIKRFIESSGCVVVSPEYRTSLDAPYPAALEDCYTSLLWLKERGKEYGMRDNQLMVGGDSAGGGLTAAITMYARDRGEVAIAFQMPLYPMLDDRMNTESATDNDAPLWNSKSNDVAWRLYLDDLFGRNDVPVYAAPARATDLSNLPPAVSFVGSIEPFHDETVAYMERLRKNGVSVKFRVFEGCFHAFDILCRNTSVGKKATAFLMEAFDYAVKHYFAEQPSK